MRAPVYILTSIGSAVVLQVLPFQMADSRYLRLTIKLFINSIQKIGESLIMPYKCEKMKIPAQYDRRNMLLRKQEDGNKKNRG